MQMITLAIPSETSEGLRGKRSDHFGHCPVFTLVDIHDNQVGNIRTVENIAHGAGGCMKPVAMLAEHGVTAMVAAGMGRGPLQKMQDHGIKVYFADLRNFPDVKSSVDGFLSGTLLMFGQEQLCTGSGNCHH
ncbi:MAG: NifB/NifX family molybdenum-iron cluster-binding protein [Desulfobulbaceae bacterium]|nr:NifB/NifX family molybdenum-iron cluster-binding protein [Desulfobulbaceae bacterium]